MDPAGVEQLRAILERQSNALTEHQDKLTNIGTTLNSYGSTMADMTVQIQQLQAQATSTPPSAPVTSAIQAPAAQPIREPRLPTPQPYAGEPGTCRSFLTQCSLSIELQPLTFTTERAKVAYVITLLTGRAREWGTAAWEAGSPFCNNFQTFTEEMRRVFDRSMHGREAARQLLQSRQGRRSVSDYAIDFSTLATNCGWGAEAQCWWTPVLTRASSMLVWLLSWACPSPLYTLHCRPTH